MAEPNSFEKRQSLYRPKEGFHAPNKSFISVILNVVLFTVKQLVLFCYAGTAVSTVFTFFILSLPFGRQFEGMVRLSFHIIRMELGQSYVSLPAGGGTIRKKQT
ncbi:uncharacterized protein CTRU02_204475 [Colletotrichum truncatum]|uniref:Uncharacterized protein n=1 Tax=Colletotrichum truncatum TaxID=5467 RepID=A0ACC3ZC54_COLTU|nr:uncharacterized protein CTRU02_02704 [Colletotrichum truncatum]KAF6797662.1 hypothetical protein CTRU02_02704 [Colletotrichum truncatum]